MSSYTVFFRDGTSKRFEDRGASGGSYYAYGKETVWPTDVLERIEKDAEVRW